MSLGRQPPPKPRPGRRNARPIRESRRASRIGHVLPPAASHTSAIALMKEIFVARKAFAATLVSSAVSSSVVKNRVPLAIGPGVYLS